MSYIPVDANFLIARFNRTQFPVRVCSCLSTNESQGQSFTAKLDPDLRDECFSHAQLYVALSRATHRDSVMVCTELDDRMRKTILYTEVLS